MVALRQDNYNEFSEAIEDRFFGCVGRGFRGSYRFFFSFFFFFGPSPTSHFILYPSSFEFDQNSN